MSNSLQEDWERICRALRPRQSSTAFGELGEAMGRIERTLADLPHLEMAAKWVLDSDYWSNKEQWREAERARLARQKETP